MAKKKAPKFLRRNTTKYLRLGKRRKKLQKWTSPRGRDNKMRIMRKGYPAIVRVGYKNEITSRGLIEGKIPVVVRNVSELLQISDNNIAVIGRVGAKKRKEITKMEEQSQASDFWADSKKAAVIMKKINDNKKEIDEIEMMQLLFEEGELEEAKKLIENKIRSGIFDRGSYAYNGRVKAVAEGLREGGLKI